MAEIRRMNCYFNLDNPLHAEAWSVLEKIPVRGRMEAIVDALLRQQDERRYRQAIQEELAQMPFRRDPVEPVAPQEKPAAGVKHRALDYIRALQGGDEIE